MDRAQFRRFGTPKMPIKPELIKSDKSRLKYTPFRLNSPQHNAVRDAIRNVCKFREHRLFALNVRTNHVHIVVSAGRKAELMMHSFKAYGTRKLRGDGLVTEADKVWARHGSTRYPWTDEHIEKATEYVLYGQGDELPEFD